MSCSNKQASMKFKHEQRCSNEIGELERNNGETKRKNRKSSSDQISSAVDIRTACFAWVHRKFTLLRAGCSLSGGFWKEPLEWESACILSCLSDIISSRKNTGAVWSTINCVGWGVGQGLNYKYILLGATSGHVEELLECLADNEVTCPRE